MSNQQLSDEYVPVIHCLLEGLRGNKYNHDAAIRMLRSALDKITTPVVGISETERKKWRPEHLLDTVVSKGKAERIRKKFYPGQFDLDHAVPLDVIAELLAKISCSGGHEIDDTQIKELVGPMLMLVVITKDEHKRLNKTLKNKMPNGWYDKKPTDPFARYEEAKIKIVLWAKNYQPEWRPFQGKVSHC